MLAGANEISAGAVGLVYFCAVFPTIVVKATGPYWYAARGACVLQCAELIHPEVIKIRAVVPHDDSYVLAGFSTSHIAHDFGQWLCFCVLRTPLWLAASPWRCSCWEYASAHFSPGWGKQPVWACPPSMTAEQPSRTGPVGLEQLVHPETAVL